MIERAHDTYDTQCKHPRMLKLITGLGAVAVCVGAAGYAFSSKEVAPLPQPQISASPQETSSISETPALETSSPQPTNRTEILVQQGISSSAIKNVNLFGDSSASIERYIPKIMNDTMDLTPPEQDGIFYAVAPAIYTDASINRTYHFGGELSTDAKGNVEGDLLIQGHTNSGGNWIMNKVSELKVGDTQTLHFGNAIYTTQITKVTNIKKTGSSNQWPGFAEALGKNGAIETCKLTTDANGNTIQSGWITVYAITIVAAKKT